MQIMIFGEQFEFILPILVAPFLLLNQSLLLSPFLMEKRELSRVKK